MRKIIILFILVSGSLLAGAQSDSLSEKNLDEVVVTGQYKAQSAKNSVYQVRVIGKERIQRQGASNLQGVLQNELNIRFAQDLATGGSDINMMGMKGQNVKILLDGLPMVGRQGTSNEININQIDINSIEKIEIVEGPMSVVYGADALAGVINIITKKAGKNKLSVTAKIQEESIGDEYGIKQGIHNQYIGITGKHKKWEAGASFGRNYFGGWKDTALDRELVWHKKDQLIANGFIGYTSGKYNIRYRIDGLDEVITNPGNYLFFQPQSGDTLANDQEYLSSRVMHQLQGSYTAGSKLNVQVQSSYTDYRRQVFSTTVSKETGDVRLDMGKDRQALINFTGFTFRSMVNYTVNDKLSFQPGVDVNLDRGEGERLKAGSNAVDDYAIFITSEITPSKKVNIRPGLRFIKNSVYNAPPLIPSINAKISLLKNLDMRLAYARGFRSPSLRELYFNFFDANHQIEGNPDLEAETSHSFTGSFTWKKLTPKEVAYTTVLSGFYNNVRNQIDYAVSANDPNVFVLTNIAGSKTAGASINTIAKYKHWNISVGGSYTGFYNDYSGTDKALPELQWSGEVNSNIGYAFSKIGMDVNLYYKFTGKRPFYAINSSQDLVLTEQEGYQLCDLSFNKKAFKYLSFNAGIRNLFDVDRITSNYASGGIHTAGGSRNIACGRSLFAGIAFNWDKK